MRSRVSSSSPPRAFLLAVGFCLAASICASEKLTTSPGAFDSISVCTPLNVLVAPSKDGASQVLIEADTASSISATVAGSLLSIETTGDIKTEGDIKITVYVPASSLRALEVRSSASVYLAPGFNSQTLQLTTGQLGGTIAASKLTAKKLSVVAAGLGKVTVEGSLGDVSVDAQGAASVHIAGLEKQATLALSGIPEVAIAANNDGATIVGTSQGSRVVYNQGTCSVTGAGGALCVLSPSLKVSAAPLRWTCKATLTGTNMCHASGSSASTFSSTGSDCSVMAEGLAGRKPFTSRRRMQQMFTSSSSSSSSGGNPTSYTYSSTITGADGQPTVSSCSFVNNIGGCQVNGTPVPVQQLTTNFPPAPTPAPLTAPSVAASTAGIVQAATAATSISTATASSLGGTSCVFVNGVGGCQTAG